MITARGCVIRNGQRAGGIGEAFSELLKPKYGEGTSHRTISRKSFWAGRIVTAILQAGNQKPGTRLLCLEPMKQEEREMRSDR